MEEKITRSEFRSLIAPTFDFIGMPEFALHNAVEAYAEHWRVYHGMDHIAGMLRGIKEFGIDAKLSTADLHKLELLIVCHDVWLKIGRERGESEHMSAKWCSDCLGGYGYGHRNHYAQFTALYGIQATIYHSLSDVPFQYRLITSYLPDLDLKGLGAPPDHFAQDTEAIWLEYQPCYTRSEFDKGRSEWAANFLQRERIYHTPEFAHLEAQARENLRALAQGR